jgi:hypothetical protein
MSTLVKTYSKPASFKATVDAGDVASGQVVIQSVPATSPLADNAIIPQITVTDASGLVQSYDGAITYLSGAITVTDAGTYTFVAGHIVNLTTMLI